MTRYNTEQIEKMKDQIVGKTVSNFSYELDGDYFVLEFITVKSASVPNTLSNDNSEFCFRFMADLL